MIAVLGLAISACNSSDQSSGNGAVAVRPSSSSFLSAGALPTRQTISEPSIDNSGPPEPRGLLSTLAFWDETFASASVSDCIAQGYRNSRLKGDDLSRDRAWRLPNGALACVDDPYSGVWGTRQIHIWVFFEPPVDESIAIATAKSLLPSDIQQIGSVEYVNHDWSVYRDSGSCKWVTFESNALAEAVNQALPDWGETAPEEKVEVILYSGNMINPDGSDQMYRPESIHVATVGIASSDYGSGC